MVRESAWKRTKAYIRRMRGNRAGGWIALLLLFIVKIQCVTSLRTNSGFDDVRANDTIEYRLPKNVIPMSYDIKLSPYIDKESFTFSGETKILIQVLNETTNITLHAYYDLIFNENTTSLSDINGKSMKPKYHYRCNKTDFLTLNFEQSIIPGNYSLKFVFSGNISSEPVGIYKSLYINDNKEKIWLISTRFSPTKARRAFPCWDEPALKATFNISIKHSSNYVATSNMPVKSETAPANGSKWTAFKTTPVMSTYLVAFVISDFQCISNSDKSINTCVQKENLSSIKYLQEINEKALPLLAEYTGIPYSLPKLDSYAIPDADSGGMENWGLIIYRGSTLMINNASYSAKESATEIAIHELAHQWFGNLVTPAWWKYVWLKEGLSRYIQFYIGNKMFPEWELMNTFVARVIQTGAFLLDSSTYYNYLNWEPKSPAEIKSHFSILVYQKGAVMIHMLSHIIGEQNLREGIRIYLKKHQYGVATSDDFWDAMQHAYDSNEEIKIKDMMDPWVEQKGYPIVTVTRNYDNGTAVITQSANLLSETNNRWFIPINFATEADPSCTCTMPTHWLKPNDPNVTIEELNKDDWLIVNLKQSGYYRVDYDEENWLKLAEYMNSDNFTTIHVLNRAQIMNDLVYMVMNDRQKLTTFLEMSKYLTREVDYISWRQAFNSFSLLKSKIQDKTFYENLKKYVLHLMTNIIDKIGFVERPTDTYMMKRWRSEIDRHACSYGHDECKKVAGELLIAYFQNSTENPLPPDAESWILNAGANNKKVEMLMQEKIYNGEYKYLKYMTAANNRTFYHDFIEKALTNSSIPKNVTAIALSHLRIGSDDNWDYAVDYFIKNIDRIYEYFNNTRSAASILNDYVWSTPCMDRMKKISEFVNKNSERIPAWMIKTITQQMKKLKWSKLNAPISNNWLEKELSVIATSA